MQDACNTDSVSMTTAAPPARPRVDRRLATELAVVATLAASVGFWAVDQANIGPDELIYQEAALRYVQGDMSANPEHPPVGKYLLGAWQVVFGSDIGSVRSLMGLVLVTTALIAFAWMRAAFGAATALTSTVLLITTHRVSGADFIDRQVMLDPFSVMFGLAALATLWWWERRRRPALAFVAGALMALAITSKASAATLLIGAMACVPWRELGAPVTWRAILSFAGAGVAVCFAVYLPVGGLDAVAAMLDFQRAHADEGHLISVAGHSYTHAPWFAALWFAGDVVGWVPLVATLAMAVVGASLCWRDRATRMLALGGLGTLVLISASPVVLPHYTLGWLWSPLLLAGVGLVALLERCKTIGARRLVAVAAIVLALGPLTGILHVATMRPTNVARVDSAMAADPAEDGVVLTLQLSSWITEPNIDAPVTEDPTDDGITAVVVGRDLRFPADPALLSFLDRSEEALQLDDVRLYLLDDELDLLLESSP